MEQKIIDFHLDSEQHWVADLACGHKRHVRHDPPFFKNEAIISSDKRCELIGSVLNCKRCDDFGVVVAKAVQEFAIEALLDAQIDAAAAAMCREGQIDLALDRLKTLKLKEVAQKAIAQATDEFGTFIR